MRKTTVSSRRREEYEVQLADEDVLKVRFDRILKKVIDFSVQYLAWIEGIWRPVVRIDTAHGKAHIDTTHPDGTKTTKDLPIQDYLMKRSLGHLSTSSAGGSSTGNVMKGG